MAAQVNETISRVRIYFLLNFVPESLKIVICPNFPFLGVSGNLGQMAFLDVWHEIWHKIHVLQVNQSHFHVVVATI